MHERARRFVWRCCIAAAIACSAACSGDDAADGGSAGTAAADGGKPAGGAARAGASAAGTGGRGGAGALAQSGRGGAGRAGAAGHDAGDDAGASYPIDAGPAGPTGSVRGQVRGFEKADAARAVVRIGDAVTGPTAAGYFFAARVPVGAAVPLSIHASGYSTAHVTVPVREGEVTPIVLDVTKLTVETIVDPKAAHESMFGGGAVKHRLSWPANALQSIYGTPPSGEVQFWSAELGAQFAPGALNASGGAEAPRPLHAFAVVEIGLAQPRAALVLTQPATLSLSLAGVGSAHPALYRFNDQSGFFDRLTAGSYDSATQTLSAAIDRTGTYAAAIVASERGCGTGRFVDASGAGVANAAVRFRDAANREAGLAWTQSDGRYCAALALGQVSMIEGLGLLRGGLVKVDEIMVSAPPSAAACGASGCVDLGTQTAVAEPVSCVHGRLSKLAISVAAQVRASGDEASGIQSSLSTMTGAEFCLDVTSETTLEFSGTRLQCGKSRALAPPVAAASCGENSCLELGEVQCCIEDDRCGGGIDEDCDGRVDEGCTCNASCTDFHTRFPGFTNHCCSPAGGCGFRYPATAPVDHCFEFSNAAVYGASCPGEQVQVGGTSRSFSGCCRNDNQCGLDLGGPCLLRSDVQYLTNMSLASIACVYPQ